MVIAAPAPRTRYRDDHDLLPVHHDLLEFFEEPRCMTREAIAEATGYSLRMVHLRARDLEAEGYITIERFPRVWSKPSAYSITDEGRAILGRRDARKVVLDLTLADIDTLIKPLDAAMLQAGEAIAASRAISPTALIRHRETLKTTITALEKARRS